MKRLIPIIIIAFLTSCSAQYHLNKAKKKGAELETRTEYKYVTDTDTVIDTLTNTIRIRTVVIDSVPYPVTTVKYVPKTRTEIRYDYKRFKDSLKYYRRMYSDSLQTALKQSKIENRTERKANNKSVRTLWLLVICGVLFIIALILIKIRPL